MPIFAQCVRDEKDIDPFMVLFNAVQKKRTFCPLVVLFLALLIMPNRGHDGRGEEETNQHQGQGHPA